MFSDECEVDKRLDNNIWQAEEVRNNGSTGGPISFPCVISSMDSVLIISVKPAKIRSDSTLRSISVTNVTKSTDSLGRIFTTRALVLNAKSTPYKQPQLECTVVQT
jgi:hypothetical protein